MTYFVNNPINEVVVVPSRSDATFHRVIAEVSVGGRIFEQSLPISGISGNSQVVFDISSSLRSYTDGIKIDYVKKTFYYQTINFSVSFREEYMQNGVLHKQKLAAEYSGQAFSGGYTDRERISSSVNSADNASFTLRPSSPMLIPQGHSFLCHTKMNGQRVAMMFSSIEDVKNTNFEPTRGSLYQVPDSRRWYDFQFINTRGVHESAFAFCYSGESVKGGVQTHVRSLRETFSTVSRRINVVEPATSVLSFSSGYVDLQWAKWWAYEFCKANKHQQHWIKMDGLWVPCSVTLKDNFQIIDRSKPQLLSVEFDVVPDLNGMI